MSSPNKKNGVWSSSTSILPKWEVMIAVVWVFDPYVEWVVLLGGGRALRGGALWTCPWRGLWKPAVFSSFCFLTMMWMILLCLDVLPCQRPKATRPMDHGPEPTKMRAQTHLSFRNWLSQIFYYGSGKLTQWELQYSDPVIANHLKLKRQPTMFCNKVSNTSPEKYLLFHYHKKGLIECHKAILYLLFHYHKKALIRVSLSNSVNRNCI
jgi:hypothetical protein